jgi:hypothetical protein
MDIQSVPAEFVKYALIVGSFILANWLMIRKGQRASGNAMEPVHLAAPVVMAAVLFQQHIQVLESRAAMVTAV